MSDSFETELAKLAIYLANRAMEDGTDLQDSAKIFKELRDYYAILTKDDPKGDKDQGRRPTTMQHMRDRIALVSRGDEDGST